MTLLPTAYWGPVSYYSTMLRSDDFQIDGCQAYERKNHVNRCRIMAANGVLTLTVPVVRPHGKVPVRDIRIDYREPWQHIHWISIISAYRTSAFFEYLMDDIKPFYDKRHEFLLDLNNEILEWTRGLPSMAAQLPDIQGLDNPKPYYQVFGQRHGFVPNLSILDLICNMGPEAATYL